MQYPVCIKWGDEHTAIDIRIPDIPGAVTSGDTVEKCRAAAIEVAHIMLEELAGRGQPVPMPTSAATHRDNPDFIGMVWSTLEIDITSYRAKT